MKKVYYKYSTRDLGCGCCSETDSTLEVYEDGKRLAEEDWTAPSLCSEEDLREYVAAVYGWTDVEMDEENEYV